MSRGDSQLMGEQRFEMGYCKTENGMRQFVSTLSPRGSWVCTSCSFKTSKLLKAPTPKFSKDYLYLNKLNGGGL